MAEEEEGGGGALVLSVLDRESSIEKEPPTLSPRQLQFAREAALDVMKNASAEEASRIFTQGLQAVKSCVHDDNNNSSSDNEETKAAAAVSLMNYRHGGDDDDLVQVVVEEEGCGGVSRPQPFSLTIPPPPPP